MHHNPHLAGDTCARLLTRHRLETPLTAVARSDADGGGPRCAQARHPRRAPPPARAEPHPRAARRHPRAARPPRRPPPPLCREKGGPRGRHAPLTAETVVEPTPLAATATPPVGSATGATARVRERGGRGAIKLGGAAAAHPRRRSGYSEALNTAAHGHRVIAQQRGGVKRGRGLDAVDSRQPGNVPVHALKPREECSAARLEQ